MADYRHDPGINYSQSLLKQAGGEQYTAGRDTAARGVSELGGVSDYFRKLLSGDTGELMNLIQPQADVINQQFSQVRKMISDQPRGGGKTQAAAQLPVEQIQALSRLLGGARQQGAAGLQGVVGQLTQTGLQETGAGLSSAQAAGEIGLQGRQQDIASSWKTFFKSLIGEAVGGLTGGIGFGLSKLSNPAQTTGAHK